MVFHLSLGSFGLQTCLSILDVFNNNVVWMASIFPLIFYSHWFFPSFWGSFRAQQLQLISPSSDFCVVLAGYIYISIFPVSFCGRSERQNHKTVNYLDYVLAGISLIFLDVFRFVHNIFGRMFTFQSLAWFQVDHLSRPVILSLILFSLLLATFHIWLIISSFSSHNLHLPFYCFINFRFNIIDYYCRVLCCN